MMTNKKVLLINPNMMKPVVAPIALDYLATSLEKQGIDYELLDLSFSKNVEQDIRRAFKHERFVAVGITVRNIDDSYFASQDFCLGKIRGIIDLVKNHTISPIVLGGVGFSIFPKPALTYCGVDFGIWGEGELAFPLLIEALIKRGNYKNIPNLLFRDRDGYQTTHLSYLDLQKINLSPRNAVDNMSYYREGGMVGFETKRGCDQACRYCADPVAKGGEVRVRPPVDVASELKGLLEKGIDTFHTGDSEFNVPEDHALEICKEIVRKKLGHRINWYAYATPSGFSEELACWMKKAGCVGINFGIDSGSARILKNLGRSHTPDCIREVTKRCHKHGFVFMFDLLLGGPGEDRKTIGETIDLMKRLNPSRVGISLGIRLYPGTYFGKIFGEKLCLSNKSFPGNLSDDMLKPLYYLSPDIDDDIQVFIKEMIAGDKRFFFGGTEDIEENYNYNDNTKLVQALKKGYKGAFWDVLRKMEEER